MYKILDKSCFGKVTGFPFGFTHIRKQKHFFVVIGLIGLLLQISETIGRERYHENQVTIKSV